MLNIIITRLWSGVTCIHINENDMLHKNKVMTAEPMTSPSICTWFAGDGKTTTGEVINPLNFEPPTKVLFVGEIETVERQIAQPRHLRSRPRAQLNAHAALQSWEAAGGVRAAII